MNLTELGNRRHLRSAFNHLRAGRHLCADDGPVYLTLRAHTDAYQQLFSALGFDLLSHPRGFFYFQSADDLGKEATQLVVFFFILVESWADAGRTLEPTAFDPAGHTIEGLPHLSRESWRACMAEAGVTDDEGILQVVRKLERHGFVEKLSPESFRFRAPAWRFFDICMDVFAESNAESETTPPGSSTTTDAPPGESV